MAEWNGRASEMIFQGKNPQYGSAKVSEVPKRSGEALGKPPLSLETLDLHGQHRGEAETLVRSHLRKCKEDGLKNTLIITGRGSHSVDGVAKLRPEVKELLKGLRVNYKTQGEGAFVVEM
jgi:DNA-nicking Smr family endonuclease